MEEYKFKAREIVIKMQFQKEPLTFEQAKKCALNAVDLAIEYNDFHIEFLQEVKQEIINL